MLLLLLFAMKVTASEARLTLDYVLYYGTNPGRETRAGQVQVGGKLKQFAGTGTR
jgi:hypothetical protein